MVMANPTLGKWLITDILTSLRMIRSWVRRSLQVSHHFLLRHWSKTVKIDATLEKLLAGVGGNKFVIKLRGDGEL